MNQIGIVPSSYNEVGRDLYLPQRVLFKQALNRVAAEHQWIICGNKILSADRTPVLTRREIQKFVWEIQQLYFRLEDADVMGTRKTNADAPRTTGVLKRAGGTDTQKEKTANYSRGLK